MNAFLFDASALAKRYAPEVGSERIEHLFRPVSQDSERLMCLAIGAAEVVSVLVRGRNSSRLSREAFAQAVRNLRAEVFDSPDFITLSVDGDLIDSSLTLIERHSVNATDAFVLQLCIDLAFEYRGAGHGVTSRTRSRSSCYTDVVLVSSDQRLLRAARAEGLLTFDPETQTQAELDALLAP